MVLVPFALLAQARLTPAALIDDLTARYGHAAIGTSLDETNAVVVSDLSQTSEVDLRVRNGWRVVRDGTVPGVFRPEVAPYAELFDEERFPLLKDGKAIGPPRPPYVTAADLSRPGGVRVTVDRLVELLDARALRVSSVYGRRTVLVRINPARMPDPVDLLAAITGGLPNADRTALELEPTGYRRLVVATLSAEAQRTEFEADPIPKGDRRAYWEQRPLRLALGAAAFHAADDESLRSLGRASGRSLLVPVPRLKGQGTEIAAQLLETYRRNDARPAFNVGKVEIPGVPEIKVSNGSGLGRLAIPPDGAGSMRFL